MEVEREKEIEAKEAKQPKKPKAKARSGFAARAKIGSRAKVKSQPKARMQEQQTTAEATVLPSETGKSVVSAADRAKQQREERLAKMDACGSISDPTLFDSFEAASAEQRAECPSILASFQSWMTKGPTPKSARGYTQQVRMMMSLHSRSIEAMISDPFIATVTKSSENIKRNNIIGAGVKKFKVWLKERGSLTGPWEVTPAADESCFMLEKKKAKAVTPAAPVVGRGSLTAYLGKAAVPPAEAAKPVKEAKGKARAKAKASGKRKVVAKGANSGGDESPAEGPGSNAAISSSNDSKAKEEPPARRRGANKVPRKKCKPENASLQAETPADISTSTPVLKDCPASSETPVTTTARATRTGTLTCLFGPRKTAEQTSESNAPMLDGNCSPGPKKSGLAEATPEKVDQPATRLPPATQAQLDLLSHTRSLLDAAVRAQDYAEAHRQHTILAERCRKLACAVPPRLTKGRSDKPVKPDEDEGEDAGPTDPIAFAKAVLEEKFPVMYPSDDQPEDDSEIMPDESTICVRKWRRDLDDDAEGMEEDDEEQKQTQLMTKALAKIPDASFEDIDRLPVVAATFREWLNGRKDADEEGVESAVKALHDLFSQDEKSLDGMATAAYAKAVSNDASHAAAMTLFAKFWAARKNGPWVDVPARAERGLETKKRQEHYVPPGWGIRVVQRAHKEDLVILTSPEGTKHFAEASKLAQLPVLSSEAFIKERERRASMSDQEKYLQQEKAFQQEKEQALQQERSGQERALQKSLQQKAEQAINEMLADQDTPSSAQLALLGTVLRQHLACAACGRVGKEADIDNLEEGAAQRANWSSYGDIPDATEEDKAAYVAVLATFELQGFPYMTGVRKLMELHKKRAQDMATEEFHRLVRRDPENVRCNGFLSSAILYLRKFRENGGFDNLVDTSTVDAKALQSLYTPDFNRESGQAQENFDDLQVDVPLELLLADATSKWRHELQETLDEEGYIQEDVDARGQRPVALSIALLPNATDAEWALWPRILAKYESFAKQHSDEVKAVKREQEASDLFMAMKDMVEVHGKSPEAMASKRYLKIVRTAFGFTDIKEKAVAKFLEFWASNKNGEFPEVKVHALAALKYKLMPQAQVEQAKQLAAEWQLPEGWAVKLGRDGRLLKVVGPAKKEEFSSKEIALEYISGKAKKQSEEAKEQRQKAQELKDARYAESNKIGSLKRRLKEALQEERYDVAQSLHEEISGIRDKEDSATIRPSRAGTMPIVARAPQDLRVGGGPKGKRKAEEANPAPLKVRKTCGLRQQLLHEVASCELTLRAGEWRVQGVRLSSGIVVPLDAPELEAVGKEAALIVLVYVDEEVRERKRRKIIDSWGLDDTWTVTLRCRRSGDMVTARRADGKVFLGKGEILAEKTKETTRKIHQEAVERATKLQEFFESCKKEKRPVWELNVSGLTCISGLYVKSGEDMYEKVQCLSPSGENVRVRRKSSTDNCSQAASWLFFVDDGNLLAYSEGASNSPFESHQLCWADGKSIPVQGVSAEHLTHSSMAGRLVAILSPPMGPRCRFCECGKAKKSSLVEEQKRMHEARLLELQQRRSRAPRTLMGIAECMLSKLKGLNLPGAGDGQLPAVLLKKQVLRVGTMCSGTDAPVLVARALQRALSTCSSSQLSFEHAFSVEFDPHKQEFLKANFPENPLLFKDCTQMGRRRAYDVISGKAQEIPGGLDVLVAGFSCKDLSMMNSFRKTLEQMGQSGSTLKGVLDYAERYRPRIILLENVWAIAKANGSGFRQVDLVMEGLKARGYAAGYRLLNSCDYYLPQIRHRIWMWGIRLDDAVPAPGEAARILARAEQATASVTAKFNEILSALEEPCALHFDDYMLEDDHPDVRSDFQRWKSKGRKNVFIKKKSAKKDWLEKYDCHRTGHDYQYERPYTAVRDAGFLQVLNEREKELLDLKCLDVLNEQGRDPRTHPMLWELSQSVERVPGTRVRRDRQNYATCILPGTLWHSSRHRWVLGIEKLALQGIFAEDLLDTRFPQRLLGDLAGNAFTTSVCAANLIAAIVCAEDLHGAAQS
eukprot:TRINITY_DN31098_c0_g1_i1.p1 TRINITY_DN31098_c0_g1~~TRINITY_DN31098_c0_g1_i1.p1  ORF type:complete len:2041 (-),score=461.67 TRINITY_DN31098_c0_g1_i1:392-6514(-)